MESHCISLFFVSDVEEAGVKSVCYGIFGLSYILFFVSFSCDAVYQVRALTGNGMLARVLDRWCSTFEGVSK